MSWIPMCLFLVGGVAIADASVGSSADAKEGSGIYPTLKPGSDKKFFGKDYPYDKRPKVDVFHFKHPYPAVQDSGDFDSDYVKDENSDNGSWKAQTEYDRLRHKLAKEKEEVAKALAAKKKAEDELHDAMKREKDQEERKKKVEEEEKKKKKKEGEVDGSHGESSQEEAESGRKYVVPGTNAPGGVTTPGKLKNESSDLQKEMDALERCKKQLLEAREKLKKLMKELEEAKKAQDKTQAALDAAQDVEDKAQSKHNSAMTKVKKEYEEYLNAKEAYEKQQAKVAQMEMDIKIAAEKVKQIRDSEDRGGGVYPTKERSGAASHSLVVIAASVLTLLLQ